VRIISVQPDREHTFIEVIGECGHAGVAELRQRVDGLLIGGARFVLVDLTGAGDVAPSTSLALAAAGRQLTRRKGMAPDGRARLVVLRGAVRGVASRPVHDVPGGGAEGHGPGGRRWVPR
jgi:hypothetical protein